jgi:uncharacterized protein (TIGR04222 family)
MIPEAHRGLWSKIQDFPLNDPNATISFAHKLATQQKWSEAFTDRVIEEYRKFIFLCCISPKGASPSYAVDQAWHLHLTYTKSYWIDFCKNTLNKDLHHHPSAGGEAEDHKHETWYAETLTLYESTIGYKPPADIWPPPRQEQHLIEEPVVNIDLNTKLKVATLMLLPFLFIYIAYGKPFPYWLGGDQFLVFYPIFAAAVIVSYVIIQKAKISVWKEVLQQHFPRDTTIFQMAQFIFGKHRAVQTAIVDLVRRSLLEVNKDGTFIVFNKRYSPPLQEMNPLLPALLKEEDGSKVSYEEITVNWHRDESFAHPVLQQLYHLTFNDSPIIQRYGIIILISVVGLARVVQGFANGYPVGFLFMELFISIPVCIYVLNQFSTRAGFFRCAREFYKKQNEDKSVYRDELVAHFGINGSSALSFFSDGLILASLFAAYPPINHGSAGTSANAAGGCSSCSSCSSGGCGGGGCGGCGGGGD